jgi:hypothetical protein
MITFFSQHDVSNMMECRTVICENCGVIQCHHSRGMLVYNMNVNLVTETIANHV